MSCIELPRSSNLIAVNPLCSKSKEGDISYQLLLGTSASSVADSDAFSSYSSQKSCADVQEVTLTFYTEDDTEQRLVVEENLRVLDLCQLLALKFNVARSHTWTLVERLTTLAIERSLEDHEDILKVYASWGPCNEQGNKFIFKQDFCKYEFFRSPQQFFPLSMLDLGSVQPDCLSESPELTKFITLQNILSSGENSPTVQSLLWCREPGKDSWKRLFFRIEGTTLCVSSASYFTKEGKDQLWPFRDLLEYEIYTSVDTGSGATPTSHGFCLKPSTCSEVNNARDLLWFCCESEKHRQCWIVALRLAKYGKKIRENYKEVQSRHSDSSPVSCKATTDSSVMNSLDSILADYTPMKPRVAMDFTGTQSRIVDDPHEAKAIAAAEGHNWKRRLPCCRGSQPQSLSSPTARPNTQMEFGVHAIQPWFYSGMSRDEATLLLTKYGTVDGVFLVRESRRNPGSFVLSYVYNHKVHHCQIFPVEEKDQLCYSLDNGRTKFYDLLQLVEFYQLNLGYSLPTKLTHFLVHRPRPSNTNDGPVLLAE